MRGGLTRIGLLFPVGGPATRAEYERFAANVDANVELHAVRTGALDRHDVSGMMETGKMERLRAGIEALRPHAPHVVAFPCTCASFGYLAGADAQAEEMSRVAGVPATSATVALGAACRATGVRRVAVAAPYPDDVTALFTRYLDGLGVRVLGSKSLGVMSGVEVTQLAPEAVFDFLVRGDLPGAEALVVPDTALLTLQHIARLEEVLGKFVITANQATMWHALRLARVALRNPPFGRLMPYDIREA